MALRLSLCRYAVPEQAPQPTHRAHDSDVRPADEAIRPVPRPSAKLQTRVGIATGWWSFGDLIGEGSAKEQSVRRRDAKPSRTAASPG
jgi:hypothetical protein